MAYNGGCLIGVGFKPNGQYYGSNSYLATPPNSYASAAGASNLTQEWQLSDGATLPGSSPGIYDYTQKMWVAGAEAFYDPVGAPSIYDKINAIFAHLPCGKISTGNITFYHEINSAYATITGTKLKGSQKSQVTKSYAEANFLALDYNRQAFCIYVNLSGYGALNIGDSWPISEAVGAYIIELPYKQELVTYRRTVTSPAKVEIKTLDGSIRQATTGQSATNINATFKWSDDGTIAKQINQILVESKNNSKPLIVYIPAGIYYNGPYLDLVIPRNDPAVIMPAPGTYELTIEGDCQP